MSVNQFSNSDALLNWMQPLIENLDIPPGMGQLFTILERFQPVLEQLISVSEQKGRRNLRSLSSMATELLLHKATVQKLLSDVANLDRRFHGYKKSHPLYCVFSEEVQDSEIAQHYTALLASAYPALLGLQRKFSEEKDEYESTAYQVSLSLRKLANPDPASKEFLLELPVQAIGYQNYLKQIESVAHKWSIKLVIGEEYTCFYWVRRLLEGMEKNSWIRSDMDQKEQRKRGSNRQLKEWKSESAVQLLRTPVQSPLEEYPDLRVVNFYRRPSKKEAASAKLLPGLQPDVQVDESTMRLQPGRIHQYHYRQQVEQTARNARYAAQAIEISNQDLPITAGTMSNFEVFCFLEALLGIDLKSWSEIPESDWRITALWAGLRFFLSRSADALQGMQVAVVDEDASLPFWNIKTGTISLSTLPPKHQEPPQDSGSLLVGNRITLKVPFILSHLLILLDAKPKGKLFGDRHAELEKYFATLLYSINREKRTGLTLPRIQRAIADRMSLLAPMDGAIGCYFQGRPPNTHIPAVYSAVPVARIQQLYDQAWKSFDGSGADGNSNFVAHELPGLVQLHAEFVGSRHVLEPDFVKNTIADVVHRIRDLSKAPAILLIELHNLYTAYVTIFLLVTTGMRSLSTVLPSLMDVDWKSGLCLASEKDNKRYTEARLVCLLPMAVEQLRCYKEHVFRLRKYLALCNPKLLDLLDHQLSADDFSSHKTPRRDQDLLALQKGVPGLFFLKDTASGVRIEGVQEHRLQELMGKDWALRIGAIRHFVRSQLLWAGCSGEAIDALIGHWLRGAQPWGRFSTLPIRIWRQRIQTILTPLAEQMGITVMPSPLQ